MSEQASELKFDKAIKLRKYKAILYSENICVISSKKKHYLETFEFSKYIESILNCLKTGKIDRKFFKEKKYSFATSKGMSLITFKDFSEMRKDDSRWFMWNPTRDQFEIFKKFLSQEIPEFDLKNLYLGWSHKIIFHCDFKQLETLFEILITFNRGDTQ